jgi:hypothetical protein
MASHDPYQSAALGDFRFAANFGHASALHKLVAKGHGHRSSD